MRVLVLSTTTGYQLRSFRDAAERIGVELVLATDRCDHIDDPWRDGALPVRFHEEEYSLIVIREAARSRPFAGVIALGDRPAVLAARVAETLALPGNHRAAAEASRNKREMRRKFLAAGLEVPWFVELPAGADPDLVAHSIGYPCVVKPLGLSGSRGVIRANSPAEMREAVARVRRLLARPAVRALRMGLEHDLLIEGFIEGPEYAVEALMTAGQLRILAIFDKPDPLDGPFFEETIYVTPSSASTAVQTAIRTTLKRAVQALGLTHGPVHAECRVNGQGVVMLELAARPIGGLCARSLRFQRTGDGEITLEELLLRHARGDELLSYERKPEASGVMMIPIPGRGLLKSVAGEGQARQVPLIEDVRITAKVDQLLEPLPEGDSYLGFIFARGAEPSAVSNALRTAHGRLQFRLGAEVPLSK